MFTHCYRLLCLSNPWIFLRLLHAGPNGAKSDLRPKSQIANSALPYSHACQLMRKLWLQPTPFKRYTLMLNAATELLEILAAKTSLKP